MSPSSPHSTSLPAEEFDLEKLYRAHGGYIQMLAFRLLGPHVDPQDLTQEVFLTALNKRPAQVFAPRAWLTSIAIGLAANFRRSRWFRERSVDKQQLPPSIEEAIDWETPETATQDRERMKLFYDCLSRLSSKKRDVLISVVVQGLGAEEVAASLGCNTKTVYSRLAAARAKLHEMLAEIETDHG